jgi:hypothetical protein
LGVQVPPGMPLKTMMPQNIQSYILNNCKIGKLVVKTIKADGRVIGLLEFDEEGYTKTLTDKIFVVGYINRLVKYGKGDLKIFINDILLDQLPVQLEHNPVAG